MTTAGVILAGGKATRMGGGDKCLLPLAGSPLLSHAIGRLGPQVDTMVLSANGAPERFAEFGLEVVADTFEDHGPLAGVLAGMRWAEKAGATHIVTVAPDTPFFPTDLAGSLAAAARREGHRIAMARSRGRAHPVFALWETSLADDLQDFLSTSPRFKMTAYAGERHPVAHADFPLAYGQDPFFNVNAPADLAEAERMIAGEKR